MFGRFGGTEILIIVVLILLLFGHSKIPNMMKNLADGLKTFKKEMKSDDKDAAAATSSPRTASATKTAKGATKKRTAVQKKSVSSVAAYVEFGTYASAAAAQTAQRKLIAKNPDLFDGLEFVVVEDAAASRRVGLRIGFDVADDAIAFRAQAIASGVKCKVIEF